MQGIKARFFYLSLTLLTALTLISSPVLANSAEEQQKVVAASQKLDINQASAEQLVSLPGIGPARAAAIIEMRTSQGDFSSLADLQKVSGIGPATLRELEPLISF
ncbi:competence protein ComEA [Marinospirillum celere]|uniref:Competence protein ComEA n=1 Tax=Marinospirillum celere TaxID=1122252 RepID=A0A1I1FT17_9GAMM|nr:ComEA family DNA-binding protein [Marinospirillum celere]SFC02464.1 competence protein ComEA [Marinospirillum celere]